MRDRSRGRTRRRLVVAALVALAGGASLAALLVLRSQHAPPPATAPHQALRALRPLRRSAEPTRLRLPVPLPDRSIAVPILMYHRVGPLSSREPAITNALTVPPAVFAAQMRWLHAAGFHAITQRQLFDALEFGGRLPPSPVLITFDDGYRDVLWNAAPVLARLHMPATAYVITSRISDGDPSFLTWPELHMLEARGFDIGSHTVHHLELPHLPPYQAFYELVASRRALEQRLGHPVQWFSYPSGAEDAGVLPLVRHAGYVLAVTTRPGDVQAGDHPLLLHRDEILATTGVRGLAALLGR